MTALPHNEDDQDTQENPQITDKTSLLIPKVGRDGMGYIWEIPEHSVSIRIDYLAPKGRELSGEFEIRHNDKFLLQGIHSLNSTESRDRLTQALSKRTNGVVPWDRLLTLFCAAVMRKEREGEATQYTVAAPIPPISYLIDRIVQEHKPNLLFGPGGSGKGILAIATCIAVASARGIGPLTVKPAVPYYFDWEDDFETFNSRVMRICTGLDIPVPHIPYRRMHGKVADHINSVARAMAQENATYAVIDSVSACAGSPGSGESWDHIAQKMFDSLDRVLDFQGRPITWLLVGHVTGDSATKPDGIAGKMFGCYSNDTEVLTNRGWLKHSELVSDDTVLAFNPVSKSLGWEHILQRHEYEYDGEMIGIKTRFTDILVTPNHRMVVKPAWGRKSVLRNNWEFQEAGTLAKSNWDTPYSTPVNDETPDLDWVVVNGREFPADAFLRLLGWWIAEGSISTHGVVLSQAEGLLAQRMRGTLDEMGLSYSWHTNTNRTEAREHEKTMCYLRCRKSRQLSDWLVEHAGSGTLNKKIPSLVFNLSTRQKKVVLEALIDGDGSRKIREHCTYHTISRQLADDVQMLSILTGNASNIQKVIRENKNINEHNAYIVSIARNSKHHINFNIATHSTRHEYTGKVYCLSVSSGAYVTRRNGKMTIQGNSIQQMNRARCAWEMRSQQEDGSDIVSATLYHGKWNHTGKKAPIGLSLYFDDETIKIESGSVARPRNNDADKVSDYFVEHGHASIRALCLATHIPEETLRKILTSQEKRFVCDESGFWDIVKSDESESKDLPW